MYIIIAYKENLILFFPSSFNETSMENSTPSQQRRSLNKKRKSPSSIRVVKLTNNRPHKQVVSIPSIHYLYS